MSTLLPADVNAMEWRLDINIEALSEPFIQRRSGAGHGYGHIDNTDSICYCDISRILHPSTDFARCKFEHL